MSRLIDFVAYDFEIKQFDIKEFYKDLDALKILNRERYDETIDSFKFLANEVFKPYITPEPKLQPEKTEPVQEFPEFEEEYKDPGLLKKLWINIFGL